MAHRIVLEGQCSSGRRQRSHVPDRVVGMLAEARAWRLAEMRQERGCTQAQVAERMGVSKGRVSQIESGQVSGTDVVARYVEALGGSLVMVAVFGDGELRKVG
ncbi:helix-turn-helix transcriptional regulator [Streptomyces sp. NPDC086554]|uniref:helix-turn-helix domain-containing protein n=1 Tax=Streptomyces sp. NPDC086554 TaxID=3154864 RepID=UPI00343E40E7